jgi:hypothetical protein
MDHRLTMAPAERRTNVRVPVALELRLARKVGRPVTVRTLELSTGGARVRSDRPLRVDEELRFDLDLPPRHHLDGVVRVLRQDRHDAYALRFEQIAPDGLDELRAFLAATGAQPLL